MITVMTTATVTEPEVISVEPCDPAKEEIVSFQQAATEVIVERFHLPPSRSTVRNYRTRGFPIEPGGPYLRMPTFQSVNGTKTTREAMNRFAAKLDALLEERDG